MKKSSVLILFLVGAVSTICLMLLFAYAPDLRDDSSNQADTLSRSAVGFAGLRQLMELSGIPSEIDRGATAGETTHPSLTILTPPVTTGREDWRDYQEQGAVLIILPKWMAASMPLRQRWVMKLGVLPVGLLQNMMRPIAQLEIVQFPGGSRNLILKGNSRLAGLPPRLGGGIENLQVLKSAPGAVLLSMAVPGNATPMPVLIQVRGGEKPIYVLTEPDLMDDLGMADQDRARTALAIIQALRQGHTPVRLDVTLNGMSRSPSLLKALFEPPFRGATICAFLAALLMALHALARFGAPESANPQLLRGKRALADNSAALVRMMGREAGMAARYVQASRDMVLASLGRRSGREQEAVLAVLEKSAGSDIHYQWLAAAAARARTGSDLTRIAAMAFAWRGKITGEH